MKRGIVMERAGKYAVVLTPDGRFHRVRAHGEIAVGQEIAFASEKNANRRLPMRSFSYVAMVASILFAFTLVPAGFPVGPSEVYAYVAVDINPSVEFSITRSEHVIEVTPINEDAERLLEKMPDLHGDRLSRALAQLIEAAKREGYVGAEGQILVATSPVKPINSKRLQQDVTKGLEFSLGGEGKKEAVASVEVPVELREEARANNLSSGKYMLYLAMKQEGKEIDLEQVRHASIADLSQQEGGIERMVSFDEKVLKQWLALEKERGSLTAAKSSNTGVPPAGELSQEAVPGNGGPGKQVLESWLAESMHALEQAIEQEKDPVKREELAHWQEVLQSEARKLESSTESQALPISRPPGGETPHKDTASASLEAGVSEEKSTPPKPTPLPKEMSQLAESVNRILQEIEQGKGEVAPEEDLSGDVDVKTVPKTVKLQSSGEATADLGEEEGSIQGETPGGGDLLPHLSLESVQE